VDDIVASFHELRAAVVAGAPTPSDGPTNLEGGS